MVSVSSLVLSPFPFFLCATFRIKVKSYFERPLSNFPSLGGTILLSKHEEQSCLSAFVLSLVDKFYSSVNTSAPRSDHELLTILQRNLDFSPFLIVKGLSSLGEFSFESLFYYSSLILQSKLSSLSIQSFQEPPTQPSNSS